MRRRPKHVLIIVIAALAVLLLIGGFLWHVHTDHKPAANHAALDQTNDASGGALSVSSGGAYDLGQLNGNKTQNGGGSAGGSSNSSGLDPAQLAQYDKYKTSQSAYFGDLKAGTGAQLTAGHKASMTYKVYLTNGAVVDQSPVSANGQPQPYTFTLGANQVIPGVEEGIVGMKVGGTRMIIVPPAAGYGAQGQGAIPPNSVLVFLVQLTNVQ